MDKTPIKGLDPRQCVYVKMHDENYGTQQLLIDGKSYEERCEGCRPDTDAIEKILADYPNRRAYLWNNMRGWAIVFRTTTNEKMFNWNNLQSLC